MGSVRASLLVSASASPIGWPLNGSFGSASFLRTTNEEASGPAVSNGAGSGGGFGMNHGTVVAGSVGTTGNRQTSVAGSDYGGEISQSGSNTNGELNAVMEVCSVGSEVLNARLTRFVDGGTVSAGDDGGTVSTGDDGGSEASPAGT